MRDGNWFHAFVFDAYFAGLQVDLVRGVHRHAAYQVTVSLDGRPHRVSGDGEAWSEGLVHLVGSNAEHAFDGSGGVQLLLWVAVDSEIGRRLSQAHLHDRQSAVLAEDVLVDFPTRELVEVMKRGGPNARVRALVDTLLGRLRASTERPSEALHPAVRRALSIIRELPTKRISAEELAARVGLSKSRLLHVFKEHTGVPLRPYLQWVRCVDALRWLSQGTSATDAALRAGFTDGAHLGRVTKQMFCVSPTSLAQTELHLALAVSDDAAPARDSTFVPAPTPSTD